MGYKWKPSASQRRAFAERMQDPNEQAAYNQRKQDKKDKFYQSLETKNTGCSFTPTKEQHDFAMFNRPNDITPEQMDACIQVISAFSCNEKVDHYYIHIVNDMRRKELNLVD